MLKIMYIRNILYTFKTKRMPDNLLLNGFLQTTLLKLNKYKRNIEIYFISDLKSMDSVKKHVFVKQ